MLNKISVIKQQQGYMLPSSAKVIDMRTKNER